MNKFNPFFEVIKKGLPYFLFAVSIIYLFPLLIQKVGVYDEAVILVGAERVLKGEFPHADFWAVYPSGQYWIIAILFKIFGSTILVERLYHLVVQALLAMSGYFLVKKISSSVGLGMLCWLLLVIQLGYRTFPGYPIFPAMLLQLISLYFLAHYFESRSSRYIIFTGLLVTLSSLFRHDFALYAFVAISVGLACSEKPSKNSTLAIFLYTCILSGLLILSLMTYKVGIVLLFDDLIKIPSEIMTKYRSIPYPPFSIANLNFYLYPSVIILSVIYSVIGIRDKSNLKKTKYVVFIVSLFGLMLLNQSRVRSDQAHILPAALIGCVLVTLYMREMSRTTFVSLLRHMSIVVLFCTIMLFDVLLLAVKWQDFVASDFDIKENPNMVAAGWAKVPEDLALTVQKVQEHLEESELLYVGVINHDQFIINEAIVYFLSSRKPATYFHQFDPGVANTRKGQKEIVQELIHNKPPIVVLTDDFKIMENDTRVDFRLDIVDDFLANNYYLKYTYGHYQILALTARRSGPRN